MIASAISHITQMAHNLPREYHSATSNQRNIFHGTFCKIQVGMNQNIGVRLQMIVFISVISCYFYIFLWHYKPLGTPSAPSRIAYLDGHPILLKSPKEMEESAPWRGTGIELARRSCLFVFSDLG